MRISGKVKVFFYNFSRKFLFRCSHITEHLKYFQYVDKKNIFSTLFFETFFWYIVLISKAIKDAKQWQETQTPIIVMARQIDDQQPPLPTMITIHTDAAWSENSLFAGFEIIIFDAAGGIVERKRIGRFCGLSPC